MKNPEIDLSTVKVIISMEDHVSWENLFNLSNTSLLGAQQLLL